MPRGNCCNCEARQDPGPIFEPSANIPYIDDMQADAAHASDTPFGVAGVVFLLPPWSHWIQVGVEDGLQHFSPVVRIGGRSRRVISVLAIDIKKA